MEHMSQKLLIGKRAAHQSSQRQRFDAMLLEVDVHAAGIGIQLQAYIMTRQLGGDVVAFEIDADLAVAIDGCRSRCKPSSELSQLSGSTVLGKAGNVGRVGKAVRGGRFPHERP
jgi:hypothetical protein